MRDMDNDLISRSKLKEDLLDRSFYPSIVKNALEKVPTVDAVSREVVEQIQWERDCAIEQLREHGIPFVGKAPDVVKVVRCRDCKHFGGVTFAYTCRLHSSSNTRVQMNGNDFCSFGERSNNDD